MCSGVQGVRGPSFDGSPVKHRATIVEQNEHQEDIIMNTETAFKLGEQVTMNEKGIQNDRLHVGTIIGMKLNENNDVIYTVDIPEMGIYDFDKDELSPSITLAMTYASAIATNTQEQLTLIGLDIASAIIKLDQSYARTKSWREEHGRTVLNETARHLTNAYEALKKL
jgi:hypothetical protein